METSFLLLFFHLYLIQHRQSVIYFMATSEIHPVFCVRANYFQHEIIAPLTPLGKTKVRIDFAVESVNKNGSKRHRIPMELASAVGAFLSVKVEPSMYELLKHLLKENLDLSLTVCPLAWKVENGSGMFFELVELEKFSLEIAE